MSNAITALWVLPGLISPHGAEPSRWAGFAKLAQWVRDLDVKRLTPSEGIRLFEAFVRIEATAAVTYAVDQTLQEEELPPQRMVSFSVYDLVPGIDPTVAEELIQALMKVGATEVPRDEPQQRPSHPWETPG